MSDWTAPTTSEATRRECAEAGLSHQWRRDSYGNNYCPTCQEPAYLCSTNFEELT